MSGTQALAAALVPGSLVGIHHFSRVWTFDLAQRDPCL